MGQYCYIIVLNHNTGFANGRFYDETFILKDSSLLDAIETCMKGINEGTVISAKTIKGAVTILN